MHFFLLVTNFSAIIINLYQELNYILYIIFIINFTTITTLYLFIYILTKINCTTMFALNNLLFAYIYNLENVERNS